MSNCPTEIFENYLITHLLITSETHHGDPVAHLFLPHYVNAVGQTTRSEPIVDIHHTDTRRARI